MYVLRIAKKGLVISILLRIRSLYIDLCYNMV